MTKIVVETPECAEAVPYAKRLLQELSKKRFAFGLPILTKQINYLDFSIYLKSSEYGDLISIRGGKAEVDDIQFSNGSEVWGYEWDNGNLVKRISLDSSGDLGEGHQTGATVISGGDGFRLQAMGKTITATETSVGSVNKRLSSYSTAFDYESPLIKLTDGDGTVAFKTVPAGYDVAALTQMQQDLFAVLGDLAPAWNATKTLSALEMPLDYGWQTFRMRWAPRVFYPNLGNAPPLPPARGLFYGRHLDPPGLILETAPASRIVTHFGGFFDHRYRDSANYYPVNGFTAGYCETVESITVTEDLAGNPIEPNKKVHRVTFFFTSFWEPATATFYSRPALPAVGYKTGQSDLQDDIRAEKFYIDYSTLLSAPPNVHWWSCKATPYPTEPPTPPEMRYPLLGILATDDINFADEGSPPITTRAWALHTNRGYTTEVASGSNYLAHSVSTNGDFVAIFTGIEKFEKVTVYDLKGARLVRETDIADKNFYTGVVVPTAPDAPLSRPFVDPANEPLPTIPDDIEFKSCVGGILNIPTGRYEAPANVNGWKTVVDGRTAVSSLWSDECWRQSTVTIIKPKDTSPASLLSEVFQVTFNGSTVTSTGWAGLGAELPYLLWFVAGEGIQNEAALATWIETSPSAALGISVSENLDIEVFENPNQIIIGWHDPLSLGTLTSDLSLNTVGPVEWVLTPEDIGTVNEDGTVTLTDQSRCKDASVKVTDFCGIIGEWSRAEETTFTWDQVPPCTSEVEPVPGEVGIEALGVAPYIFQSTSFQFAVIGCTSLQRLPKYADGEKVPSEDIRVNIQRKNSKCCGESMPPIDITDSCGITVRATPTSSQDEHVAVSIYTVDAFDIGAVYTADGGCQPYVWEASTGLTIETSSSYASDESNSECRIVDYDPCFAPFTLTLAESCLTFSPGDPEGQTDISTPWSTSIELGEALPDLELSGPTTGVVIGSEYTASGGLAPYTYSISDGSIDEDTGEITAIACATATVTATDSCGTEVDLNITFAPSLVALSGPLTGVVVGSTYTASGGVPPYTWSVSSGAISSAGVITSIVCTPGSSASVTVTVTDSCGTSDSELVLLAAGKWVQKVIATAKTSCLSTAGSCWYAFTVGKVVGNHRYVTHIGSSNDATPGCAYVFSPNYSDSTNWNNSNPSYGTQPDAAQIGGSIIAIESVCSGQTIPTIGSYLTSNCAYPCYPPYGTYRWGTDSQAVERWECL